MVQVFVNTDPALCRERRPDADQSAFEPPEHFELEVRLHETRIDAAVEQIIALLRTRGQLG